MQTLRAVQLRSFTLGIAGVADVVEKHGAALTPVECKRGKPKAHRADEVQMLEDSMTPWDFKRKLLVNCTCTYGGNCQFNGLPDQSRTGRVGINPLPYC